MPESSGQKNPGSQLLTSLASSGDRWIQLALIALIAFTGGGNFLTTINRTDENRAEILQAFKQINEIHGTIESSVNRQKEINADVKTAIQQQEQYSKETLEILQRIEAKMK